MPQIRNVTAVLGPTNTGKTHHGGGAHVGPRRRHDRSAVRLLAREIYDRVRLKVGDHAVALVTGEEKIIPAEPRYWVATVEAMPPDISVPFLAIDEVQLCADFERGHIFTDRVLHRRGNEETMLLGAATMKPILEACFPKPISSRARAFPNSPMRAKENEPVARPVGHCRFLGRYGLRRGRTHPAPERRRGRGHGRPLAPHPQCARWPSTNPGMWTTSWPPTPSAWASTWMWTMWPSPPPGNSMASSTAISMPGELGQVAGRAGRYMNDGTFGVTGEAEAFDQETIDRLENHNFDPSVRCNGATRILTSAPWRASAAA